jgi:hypothetical protein
LFLLLPLSLDLPLVPGLLKFPDFLLRHPNLVPALAAATEARLRVAHAERAVALSLPRGGDTRSDAVQAEETAPLCREDLEGLQPCLAPGL